MTNAMNKMNVMNTMNIGQKLNFGICYSTRLDLENDLTVRKRSTRKPRSRYQSPLKMISGIFRTKSLTPQKARKTKKATFKRYSDSAAGSFDFD